jgi:hypothetical protein
MNAHRPELADVIRTHQQDLLARWNPVLSREQRKALRDIANCRRPLSAGASNNVVSADIASSYITHVVIITAPSARQRRAPAG